MDSTGLSEAKTYNFKADTKQLLNILVHSLYSDRDVFLRELISNASDALTRMHFEILTNRDILDPQVGLEIWIDYDQENKTITIKDTGIGMTNDEVIENLGTVAHSGAKAFLEAAQSGNSTPSDIIGQFGVGFYSAFIVAKSIEVITKSCQPTAQAVSWSSSGDENFTTHPSDKTDRGTTVILSLRDDAYEFLNESRLYEIIKKYSDYISFPIYIGKQDHQVNQTTALWRQPSRQVDQVQYQTFYKQLTLDSSEPLSYIHLAIDAPVQFYAILFIPSSPEHHILTPRKKDGINLYAKKVLIQEYCTDLLPDYLSFVQGVLDSEDLPLNISRETVHSNRIMNQLKNVVTQKILEVISVLAKEKSEDYEKFWKSFSRYIKQGIATDNTHSTSLVSLLRFFTLKSTSHLLSLDDYISTLNTDQKKIYYLLGKDNQRMLHSPHIELFQKLDIDVLLLSDPLDPVMLLQLTEYKGYHFVNALTESLSTPQDNTYKPDESIPEDKYETIISRFKQILQERVADVRISRNLVDSPARLVDEVGSLPQEIQHVYQLLEREYRVPQKVLEINPNNVLVLKLHSLPESHPLIEDTVLQIFENALLVEGLPVDPALMTIRIQKFMEKALTQEVILPKPKKSRKTLPPKSD
jgi:molecular chaperone HtpG